MSTKVVTGLVRFSYANVFEPRANDEGKLSYSCSLIIPKSDTATISAIRKAIAAAKEQGKSSKWDGVIPPTMRDTLRDGDLERPNDPAYKGAYFINANANADRRPNVVDANVQPILDRNDFKSGDYGRASLNFFPFKAKGNKGVGVGLNSVQKLKDGEPLGSVSRPEEDFAVSVDYDDMN
ncbi:DUF2815 family protein [Dyadobacter endophyticus]|uniref:DUF2815 family protein n=1 Tax=Dyadobacter endophyticus TaxID=1749036 RepID=UPI003CFB4742